MTSCRLCREWEGENAGAARCAQPGGLWSGSIYPACAAVCDVHAPGSKASRAGSGRRTAILASISCTKANPRQWRNTKHFWRIKASISSCRQQIGRARATGNAEAPLIPDIGNPFDGMTGNGIIRRQLASCRDAGHGAEKKPNCRGKRETTAAEA